MTYEFCACITMIKMQDFLHHGIVKSSSKQEDKNGKEMLKHANPVLNRYHFFRLHWTLAAALDLQRYEPIGPGSRA